MTAEKAISLFVVFLRFSRWVVSDTFLTLWSVQRARLLCPWDFPGKNIGVDCHFLLQGIFPTQGSNTLLLHQQAESLPLSFQECPSHCSICINLIISGNEYLLCLLVTCVFYCVNYLFMKCIHLCIKRSSFFILVFQCSLCVRHIGFCLQVLLGISCVIFLLILF